MEKVPRRILTFVLFSVWISSMVHGSHVVVVIFRVGVLVVVVIIFVHGSTSSIIRTTPSSPSAAPAMPHASSICARLRTNGRRRWRWRCGGGRRGSSGFFVQCFIPAAKNKQYYNYVALAHIRIGRYIVMYFIMALIECARNVKDERIVPGTDGQCTLNRRSVYDTAFLITLCSI